MVQVEQAAWPRERRIRFARVTALLAGAASVIPSCWMLSLGPFKPSEWNLVHLVVLLLPWPGLVGAFILRRRPDEAIALFLFSAAGCGYMSVFLFPLPFWVPAALFWFVAVGFAWGPAPTAQLPAPHS